jgi:hypothetical protein
MIFPLSPRERGNEGERPLGSREQGAESTEQGAPGAVQKNGTVKVKYCDFKKT